MPFDYVKVASLIERILQARGSTISVSVAGFLEQYARTLRRHVLETTDNIDELALQIYDKHRAAINLIINAKPALEAKGWDVIDKGIERFAPSLQVDVNAKNYHRFYASELDMIPELKEGKGWTSTGRILLFEVRYSQGRLALIIGPGPKETRKRLYNLPQMRGSKSLGDKWNTVYSKLLLTKGGLPMPDYEKAEQHVEQAIADFFKNDYWPLVNAIRAEFGLPAVALPLGEVGPA